jgi:serine/threonine protein kinase
VHEHGYLHRDVKPANVLLDGRGADTRLRGKLTDFGIASIIGAEQGEFTTGTAAYLGPEQVEGRDAVPATDVYSLGLVLLEALTGRIAFPGTVVESAFARLDRDPAIPTDVPADLAAILARMTARRPADRPTAAEAVPIFREIIVRHLGGERTPDTRDPEAERLAAVRDSNLLDTPPDAEFDRMTALAARIFDVPVALLGLVDEDRVWLKSRQGLDVAELDRTRGFGSIDALHEDTLVIEDVTTDPRTADLPGSAESTYRFYAGVPLRTADGYNLGSFAIADVRPRHLSPTEIATLEDLAAMALHEMELRRAARRIALGGSARRE